MGFTDIHIVLFPFLSLPIVCFLLLFYSSVLHLNSSRLVH